MTDVFLLVKVTLTMMDCKNSQYFYQFTKLSICQLFLQMQSKIWNLNFKRLSNGKKSLLLHKVFFSITDIHEQFKIRIRIEFNESFWKQNKVTFTPKNVVNSFTAYEVVKWLRDLNAYVALKDVELLS